MVGDERDTRDGHYSYNSVEPFASQHPLICSNMGTVQHWMNIVRPLECRLRAQQLPGASLQRVWLDAKCEVGSGQHLAGKAAMNAACCDSSSVPAQLSRACPQQAAAASAAASQLMLRLF